MAWNVLGDDQVPTKNNKKDKRSLEEIISDIDWDFLKSSVCIAPFAEMTPPSIVPNLTPPNRLQEILQHMDKEFLQSDISVAKYADMHTVVADMHTVAPPSKVPAAKDELQHIVQQMDAEVVVKDSDWIGQFCQDFDDDDFGCHKK